MAIRRLCEAALAGTPFPLLGDGRQSRDFTHVDDAVDATVRAMHASEPAPLLNVGGGEEASMSSLIETIGAMAGRPVPVVRSGAQAGDVTRTRADTTRARHCLRWRPVVGLTEGLRSELDWVADRQARRPARGPRARTGAELVMPDPPLHVVVAGQGYVGLPLAMRAVAAGHHVVGFDVSVERVKRLAAGESFVEDVPSQTVQEALASGRYRVTDTPSGARGSTSRSSACRPRSTRAGRTSPTSSPRRSRSRRSWCAGSLVVLESTSYPGTTESLLVPCLESGSGLRAGIDFHVGYSPERIDPGNAVWTLETTPKLVSGIDARSLERTEAFYRTLVTDTVRVGSTGAAELAKLLENTFRHVNIALVNELAMVADDLDLDVWEVIDAAATKPFGFMKFSPGPGVGGHCLPIDPSYLSWTVRRRLGRAFRFVELANDVNDHMPDYVHTRLVQALNRRGLAMSGARVLLLGLAYKRNSSDARESPAVRLVGHLVGAGAVVTVVDPHVVEDVLPDVDVRRAELSPAELAAQDAVVLVTDHDAFDYDAVLQHAAYVLDTRHRLEGPRVEHL